MERQQQKHDLLKDFGWLPHKFSDKKMGWVNPVTMVSYSDTDAAFEALAIHHLTFLAQEKEKEQEKEQEKNSLLNHYELRELNDGKIMNAVEAYKDRVGAGHKEALGVVLRCVKPRPPHFNRDEMAAVDAGQLWRAIKLYRERTGSSLSLAKAVYDFVSYR